MSKPFIICIIDDDDVYQYSITRTIERQKLVRKILVFSDGDEALHYMLDNVDNSSNLPDVIFLDINMPVMDGFQFMEEYIKLKPQLSKQITIYMATSSVDEVDIKRAKQISEIADYLVKPIEPDKLLSIIENLESSANR